MVAFKFAQFHIDGKVCDCEEQNLHWDTKIVYSATIGKVGIVIKCLTCGAGIDVPHDQFVAEIVQHSADGEDARYNQWFAKPLIDGAVQKKTKAN